MFRTHYAKKVSAELDGHTVTLAGWIHEIRDLGGLTFLLVRDRTGIRQVLIKKKEAQPDLLETVKHLVKETAVCATGKVKKSAQAQGGVEIVLEKIDVLGKVYKKV